MADYVSSALFIYSEEGREFVAKIAENSHGVDITPVPVKVLLDSEKEYLQDCLHVVVCGSIHIIKKIMRLAMEYQFSLGFIPLSSQQSLIRSYGLPEDFTEAISLALQSDPQSDPSNLDIVLCNDQILLFKARVGLIPLVDNSEKMNKIKLILNGLKQLFSLHLLPFTITTSGKKIRSFQQLPAVVCYLQILNTVLHLA